MTVQHIGAIGGTQTVGRVQTQPRTYKTLNTIATKISERASALDSVVKNVSRSMSALDVAISNGNKIMQTLKKMQTRTMQATMEKSTEKLQVLDKEHQQDKASVNDFVRKSAVHDINLLKSSASKLVFGGNSSMDVLSTGVGTAELGIDQDSLANRNQIIVARRNIQIKAMPKIRNALLNLGQTEKKLQVKKSFAQTKMRSLHQGIKLQSHQKAIQTALHVQKEIGKGTRPLGAGVEEFLP